MSLEGKRIGVGFTGSHCTYSDVFPQLERLMEENVEVVPVVTDTVRTTDTRFGKAKDHLQKIEDITGKKIITTIKDAEPLGPVAPLDIMVIAPITGNSLSKMANGQTDNAVLMAAKATMRNEDNVVLGIATNDALSLNGPNLMRLMASKNVYFIPYGQDDPYLKPNSLVSDMDMLVDTVKKALFNEQIQPVIIPHTD